MSLVVPAYNEEDRLGIMLTEAVEYLEQEYGASQPRTSENGSVKARMNGHNGTPNGHAIHRSTNLNQGWEILIVSDGSTDKTIETALNFAKDLGTKSSALIRVVSLQENRGKGGAVTHGLRHVRGRYAVFADADGASRFTDLGKLVKACEQVKDIEGRGVAVGSRAHLVGSDEVIKVSELSICNVGALTNTALVPAELPHAFLPSLPATSDASCNCSDTRHTMRVQIILPPFFAIYYTIYALGRLDF